MFLLDVSLKQNCQNFVAYDQRLKNGLKMTYIINQLSKFWTRLRKLTKSGGDGDKSQGRHSALCPWCQRGRNEGYYRVLPSMPKGEIVGNMEDAIIGIDVNIYTICDIW